MCKNNEEQYIANNNQNCLLAAINEKEVPLRVALRRQEGRRCRPPNTPPRSPRRRQPERDGGGRGGAEAGDHPSPTLSNSPHSFSPQTSDTNSHQTPVQLPSSDPGSSSPDLVSPVGELGALLGAWGTGHHRLVAPFASSEGPGRRGPWARVAIDIDENMMYMTSKFNVYT